MANFSVFEAGDPAEWSKLTMSHPAFSKPIHGKFFLGDVLGLDGMEVSLNVLPSGAEVPFLHTHREHEELYLFLSGRGELLVDGERIHVGPGSAVRVAPEGERSWRNTGQEPLVHVVVQATAGSLASRATDDGVLVPNVKPWS